jgi:hypothetical protein
MVGGCCPAAHPRRNQIQPQIYGTPGQVFARGTQIGGIENRVIGQSGDRVIGKTKKKYG